MRFPCINEGINEKSTHMSIVEDAEQMLLPELTQIVRSGLPGVHEPGLEQELSDEDLVGYGKKADLVFVCCT